MPNGKDDTAGSIKEFAANAWKLGQMPNLLDVRMLLRDTRFFRILDVKVHRTRNHIASVRPFPVSTFPTIPYSNSFREDPTQVHHFSCFLTNLW